MNSDRTILVVDDDPRMRRALIRALDGVCNIIEADCATEALKLLAEQHVDVVLSDHDMPGMCGLDLLRTVRLRHPRVHRLIVTAARDFDIAVRAINLGEVERFITKPWKDDELLCSVNDALDRVDVAEAEESLRARARQQVTSVRDLERSFPGITHVERDKSGAIVVDDEV